MVWIGKGDDTNASANEWNMEMMIHLIICVQERGRFFCCYFFWFTDCVTCVLVRVVVRVLLDFADAWMGGCL